MPSDFGLTVRRHERHQLSLPALAGIASHPVPAIGVDGFVGGRLRFSAESGISEAGASCTVVDLGEGGLGVRLGVFIPHGAILRVRILGEGGSVATPRLDVNVRVQRVSMTDRRPTYVLGTSFADLSPATRMNVQTLIAELAQPVASGGSAPC